jgi:hypothetical protein
MRESACILCKPLSKHGDGGGGRGARGSLPAALVLNSDKYIGTYIVFLVHVPS